MTYRPNVSCGVVAFLTTVYGTPSFFAISMIMSFALTMPAAGLAASSAPNGVAQSDGKKLIRFLEYCRASINLNWLLRARPETAELGSVSSDRLQRGTTAISRTGWMLSSHDEMEVFQALSESISAVVQVENSFFRFDRILVWI